MSPTTEPVVFSCTPHGAVAQGQRRMANLFAVLGIALLVAAGFAIVTRQILAAALALVLSFGVFVIYRMSRELEPTELTVDGESLKILMRHALRSLPLEDSRARRLGAEEVEHLINLTSTGGFVAGAGGFDSHLLGEFDLYASQLEKAVLVESMDGRVVVTPDNPEAFLDAVSQPPSS